ncbi:MAG: FAD-dependent oxidoreductase, partial [Proteobacteria bacterium]|nr:FAD-dependent oxidoreductase [Pseudomonadota bacterium]
MKAIILGSGITGITTAYFLAKSGLEVTVLEKENGNALGCSYANGGQLSFSHAEPWSSGSSLSSILKAAFIGKLNKNSFLSFDQKAIDKEFLKWSLEFALNSRKVKNKAITEKLLKIGADSRDVLAAILQEEDIDFDYKQEGILHFYRQEKAFKKAVKQAQLQQSLGCEIEVLDAQQCVKKEANLAKLMDSKKLAGGIFYKDDASGNSLNFANQLAEICKNKLGVTFEYNTVVKNILNNRKKVTGINSNKEVFVADYYISTLGSYGNSLLNGIGVNLDIYPVKGYSLSIPSDSKEFTSPNLSLTDPENKIVYSKLGNVFRAAGTVEICGLKGSKNQHNINFLKKTIRSSYSNFGNLDQAQEWFGFRPYRPDCLPMVCQSNKYPNLFINSGHGSLGWTMS